MLQELPGGGQAYVVSFPEYVLVPRIRVAGNYCLTRVTRYKSKPMQCPNCMKYGHAAGRFNAQSVTCRECSIHHRTDDCSGEDLRCANCQCEHQSGHASYPERKRALLKFSFARWSVEVKLIAYFYEMILH